MFEKIFKKKIKKNIESNNILVTALLIHAAKIDENYSETEKKIITKAIMDLNKLDLNKAEQVMKDAEKKEEESNQIIEFTREIKKYPIEFRLKHLSDPRVIELIEKVRDISKWTDRSSGLPKGFAFSRYKNSGAYCAMVVEINVDEDIELINAWAAIDAGEVVNADGVKNQIEGGIIQATSCTLIEEVNFDGEIISATDWENYPIIKLCTNILK